MFVVWTSCARPLAPMKHANQPHRLGLLWLYRIWRQDCGTSPALLRRAQGGACLRLSNIVIGKGAAGLNETWSDWLQTIPTDVWILAQLSVLS